MDKDSSGLFDDSLSNQDSSRLFDSGLDNQNSSGLFNDMQRTSIDKFTKSYNENFTTVEIGEKEEHNK